MPLSSRRRQRTLLRRVGHLAWKILRALLLAGAAMGPSVPPPPPPPQMIEAKAEDGAAEDED